MAYQLDELLVKLGAPEALENYIEWHYFDARHNDLAGFAEVRLEAGGARLIAELKHTRENYEDDHGNIHGSFIESFHMLAARTADGGYKIATIAFDGTEYKDPQKNIIELGLSMFHARALDISIMMVEQTFNKQDILDVAPEPEYHFRKAIFSKLESVSRQNFGVVIPFRPREARVG